MNSLLPALNYEFPGVSDEAAVRAEVDYLTDQVATATRQLAIERQCAVSIHGARNTAIISSPAMRLIYDRGDDPKLKPADIAADDMLQAAFGKRPVAEALSDELTQALSKKVRAGAHPDKGGDTEVAKRVGQALEGMDRDQAFSIATALLEASAVPQNQDIQSLRDERSVLLPVLASLIPLFENEEEAKRHADKEIAGAQWRIRTQAAFMTVDLVTGGEEAWLSFLQSIVNPHDPRPVLIDMVNRVQPELLSLQERIVKGDPIAADELDIASIDEVLERIWSTLGNKGGSLSYRPPYQNWLEVLLPVMRLLDPGQKAGEQYTHFGPPIRLVSAPPPYQRRGYGDLSVEEIAFDQELRSHTKSDPQFNSYIKKDYY